MSQYNGETYTNQAYAPYQQHMESQQYSNGPIYGQSLQVPLQQAPPLYQEALSPQPQYHQSGENASYYYGVPVSNQKEFEDQGGEKGLGSTVIGGVAGGYAGHKMHGGKLATAGGAALGAIGVNYANHKL